MRTRGLTFVALLLAACTPNAEAPGEPTDLPPLTPKPQPAVCEDPARDPGRVTLHRLNRAEYDNTVRDLLGTEERPARDFPNDDHGHGFDNNADVLSMSGLLADKYARAAELLVEAILAAPYEGPTVERGEAEGLQGSAGVATPDTWNLYSNGEVDYPITVDIEGQYILRTRVFGRQAGPEPARAQMLIDRQDLGIFDVPETSDAPRVLEVTVPLTAGPHIFSVGFTNDYYNPDLGEDRNLYVDWLEVEGPLDYEPPPTNEAAYREIVRCDPDEDGNEACMRASLAGFARRAWRRPVTAGEEDRLFALANLAFEEGDGFNVGLGLGMQAILLSPHFLFRVEIDPEPASADPHRLNAHELAARLSYFLWSSMPDEALAAKADDGTLLRTEVLHSEARRMLADPKAEALVDNFAGQWLYTRRVDDLFPDPAVYPDFDEALRSAMAGETRAFVGSFMNDEQSMLNMLGTDYTFLNDRLADHYGLPAVGSDTLVKVPLQNSERGGLITQASVLAVTSRPQRTSPVIRGKWILEELLCRPPPPPPPGVEGFPEDVTAGTVRERLAQHRENPTCASCHNIMDPLGLALEHFDGIGQWRTHDGDSPVDATGTLPDGRAFDGAAELAAVLKADVDTPSCFTERTFTYALGRGPEAYDRCNLDDITRDFVEGGSSFEDLVVAIVSHPAFHSRRGEPEAE